MLSYQGSWRPVIAGGFVQGHLAVSGVVEVVQHQIAAGGLGLPEGQAVAALPSAAAARRRWWSWAGIVLWAVLALVVVDRERLLKEFSFKWTDHDQTTLWLIASETARGRIHEPCFPGQAYNVALEPWLAAPLVGAGMPHYWCMPVLTSLLGLLPFIALAAGAWAAKQRWAAVLALLVPLMMPVEYGIVTSMPRGFVTGLAVAAPAVMLWVFHRSKTGFFLAALLAGLALVCNPNACILLLAAGVYGGFKNWNRWTFYPLTWAGLWLGWSATWMIEAFYAWHRNWIVHDPKKGITFDFNDLVQGYEQLDKFFGHFAPIWEKGAVVLWVLGGLVVLLLLVLEIRGALALLLATGFMVVGLGIQKVHDSHPTVFFSGSRMYLAVPVLLALGLVWLDMGLERRKKKGWVAGAVRTLVIVATLLALGAKHHTFLDNPHRLVEDTQPIEVCTTQEVFANAQLLARLSKQYGAGVVLFGSGRGAPLVYATPVLTHFEVETLYPRYERRTWRLQEEETLQREKILIFTEYDRGVYQDAKQRYPKVRIVNKRPQVILVEPGGETLIDVAENLGLHVRSH